MESAAVEIESISITGTSAIWSQNMFGEYCERTCAFKKCIMGANKIVHQARHLSAHG